MNEEKATSNSDFSPYQLFMLDVKKRNEEFYNSLSPIEINKRIAYQWISMSQVERRSYYERCGVHIDKSIASKIRKLNKDTNSSNESMMNSDENRDQIIDHLADKNIEVVDENQHGKKSNREFNLSDEDIDYSTPKKRRGKRKKGIKKSSYDSNNNQDNEDNYVPPRRGRGGRRRKS